MKNCILFSALILMSLMNGCSTNEQNKEQTENADFSNRLSSEEIKNARLTPEILWKMGRLGEMQLSPDGSALIYTVKRFDIRTDKNHAWIFSVPVTGGTPVNLTEDIASCSNPRWIDNKNIAFLCKMNDQMVIWTMQADGSDKQVASLVPGDINGFEFASDGKKLFYLQDVKMDPATTDRYPDLPLAKGMVIEDMMYRHWDSWNDYSYSHIFISEMINGKIEAGKDIMKDEPFDAPLPPYFDIRDIAWNPDGSMLAYASKKLRGREFSESTNSDIYLYDNNGNTKNITEGMPGYDRYPVFSPDGHQLAFMSMETPGYEADKERLFVYDLRDENKTYLTENLDQNAAHFVWSEDSKKIEFISGVKATYQVFECTLETRTIRQVTKGMHDYTDLALQGGNLVATKASMSIPAEIYKIDSATGSDVQLTFTNKNIYDVIRIGKVEERWVKTTDGKQMLVWIIFPPDFDPGKKYPALLYCPGLVSDRSSRSRPRR